MRSPTRAAGRDEAMNMTPMIDVVFLLIIFFLVSSHLARQETQLELTLPDAETGDTAIDDDRTRVTVNVLPSGEVQIAGQPTPVSALATRLALEQSQAGEAVEVRLRSDRAAPYAVVEPILVACAKAGVWKVTFAVTETTRP